MTHSRTLLNRKKELAIIGFNAMYPNEAPVYKASLTAKEGLKLYILEGDNLPLHLQNDALKTHFKGDTEGSRLAIESLVERGEEIEKQEKRPTWQTLTNGELNQLKRQKVTRLEIIGRRWFDSYYGNTYFSLRVLVNDIEVIHQPYEYGYGSMFSQVAYEYLQKIGVIDMTDPTRPDRKVATWQWKESNGVYIIERVENVKRKKDL